MMRTPLADVGRHPLSARLAARRWATALYVPHGGDAAPSAGRTPHRLAFALLGTPAIAVVRQRIESRGRRRPAPAIHRLAATEVLPFAALCWQTTHARQGGEK